MALLDEIEPAQPATRQAFTEGSLKSADEIAARMAPEHPAFGTRTRRSASWP